MRVHLRVETQFQIWTHSDQKLRARFLEQHGLTYKESRSEADMSSISPVKLSARFVKLKLVLAVLSIASLDWVTVHM